MIASKSHNAAVVVGASLPELDADQTYQVWRMQDGKPTSVGLLGRGPGMLYVEEHQGRRRLRGHGGAGRRVAQADQRPDRRHAGLTARSDLGGHGAAHATGNNGRRARADRPHLLRDGRVVAVLRPARRRVRRAWLGRGGASASRIRARTSPSPPAASTGATTTRSPTSPMPWPRPGPRIPSVRSSCWGTAWARSSAPATSCIVTRPTGSCASPHPCRTRSTSRTPACRCGRSARSSRSWPRCAGSCRRRSSARPARGR